MFVLWSFLLALGLALFAYTIESMFNNTHALFERTSTPRTVSGPFRRFRENHNFLLVRNLRSADAASLRRIIVPSVIAFVAMFFIGWLADGIWSDGWVYVWYVLASASIVAVVGLIVYFIVWWFQGGTTLLELLAFVPLFALMWLPLKSAMSLLNTLLLSWNWLDSNSQVIRSFTKDTIPIVTMIVVAGLLLFHYFLHKWSDSGRVRKGMMALAVIALCLSLIASSIVTARGAGWEFPASKNGGGIAGTPGPDQVDIDSAISDLTVAKVEPVELERLMLEKYEDISWEFDDSSLSPHDRSRVKSTGMSDAVTYGIVSDDEDGVRKESYECLLRNVVVAVGYANALRNQRIGNRRIGDLNPWMDQMVEEQETGGQSGLKGVNHWLTYHGDDRSTIYVTTEFRCYAATICTFFDRLIYQGKQGKNTIENWCLNGAMLDNDRACVMADYQHNKEAHIFTYVGKNEAQSGNPKGLFTIGIDDLDKRPEFFGEEDPPEVVKTPPTGGGDTPKTTPTTNPGKGDDPTTAPTEAPTDSKYNKDPNKAQYDNAEPNDDSGSYEDSNNGEGATTSAKDSQYNSGNSSSKENHNTQSEQQKKNSNTTNAPSTNGGGASVNVDSNASGGTGNGGIDSQTKISDPAKTYDGQSVDNESGNDHLGSVPD